MSAQSPIAARLTALNAILKNHSGLILIGHLTVAEQLLRYLADSEECLQDGLAPLLDSLHDTLCVLHCSSELSIQWAAEQALAQSERCGEVIMKATEQYYDMVSIQQYTGC